jgi:FKBP-type peptidyl-prolyl cis-trans isomerase FklB
MNFFNLLIIATIFIAFTFVASNADEAKGKKGDMNSYLKRTGEKYLKDIEEKEGIIKLKSGMLVEIISPSTKPDAKSPRKDDQCDVTYSGTLKDGSQFDAGRTSFAPNQVIKGWTEALQLMTEGDKWKLYIPYDLAYGERGMPPKIPGYSPLIFELEIHEVKGKGKSGDKARKAFEEAKASPAADL